MPDPATNDNRRYTDSLLYQMNKLVELTDMLQTTPLEKHVIGECITNIYSTLNMLRENLE